jgi:hypothetical protein
LKAVVVVLSVLMVEEHPVRMSHAAGISASVESLIRSGFMFGFRRVTNRFAEARTRAGIVNWKPVLTEMPNSKGLRQSTENLKLKICLTLNLFGHVSGNEVAGFRLDEL